MGICGSTCMTDKSTLTTPVGSCECAHSVCSCLCEKAKEIEQSPEVQQIERALKHELTVIEHHMREKLMDALKRDGTVLAVHVGELIPGLTKAISVKIEEI
jgi:predicted class III extradiol MEMO1 family dioxygenase